MNEEKAIKIQREPIKKSIHVIERFHWSQRVAHAILLTSFSLLGITGLPQKFSLTGWAQELIRIFGGIETTRLIHRSSAVVLILLTMFHVFDMAYKIYVKRTRLSMLPGIQDVKDGLQAFLYNLGFSKKRPQMGRYTFEEKAEYWALIWGTVIMAITGFMMWNPITTARLLPGEFIPASKAAHGGEAMLAVMAIVVWHMYGVHVRRFNKAMFTGKQTEEEMLHEHPLELADIKAGIAERPAEPRDVRKRQKVYFPVASVLAVGMLFGVYRFINGEKTSITTVLPIANPVQIYVPQTPTPIPTVVASVIPSGKLTWDGSIGTIFQSVCGMCHNASLATKGLSLASYIEALRGGSDGPVIVPGDAAKSKLFILQSAGGHPGQLSPDQLAAVKDWINAGALEK